MGEETSIYTGNISHDRPYLVNCILPSYYLPYCFISWLSLSPTLPFLPSLSFTLRVFFMFSPRCLRFVGVELVRRACSCSASFSWSLSLQWTSSSTRWRHSMASSVHSSTSWVAVCWPLQVLIWYLWIFIWFTSFIARICIAPLQGWGVQRHSQPQGRAYFKQDLQLYKTWQSANWQFSNCTFYTALLNFTTVQIAH